jgi:hypothetical protein
MASSKIEVKYFLSQVGNILNQQNSFQLIPRRKNLVAIYRKGLSIDSVKEYIKNLTVKDYSKGPEKDDNKSFSGDVWIFLLCCLSFHDAEHDLKFPFN